MKLVKTTLSPERLLRNLAEWGESVLLERGGSLIRGWLAGRKADAPELSALADDPDLRRRAMDATEEWDSALARLRSADPDSFYVALVGQQNSGKSTLGNVLLGRDEFEAADRIVTRRSQEARSADGVIYVDTPGFGVVDPADDRTSRDAWSRANLVIFLHSALLGGRDQKEEEDMLRELAAALPDAAERILLLCTKAGGRSREELDAVMEDFSSLAREIVGEGARILAADSLDYLAARGNPAHAGLERESGVPAVREWISLHRHMPSPAAHLLEREKERVLAVLAEASAAVDAAARRLQDDVTRTEERLERIWKDGRPAFDVAWKIRAGERGGK